MALDWPQEELLRLRLAELACTTRMVVVQTEVTPDGASQTVLAHESGPCIIDWIGTTYRFASRNFAARERFTDGEGARRCGGRFTPIGGARTVYLSLDRATATAELDSWYTYYGVPDTAFQPRLLAAVAVCVTKILDLTATDTVAALGLTGEHLAEEWRIESDTGIVARTQRLGQLIHEAGFEGLRFASVRRPEGVNLALFPENYREGSHAVMIDPE